MRSETATTSSSLPVEWMEQQEPFFLGRPFTRVWLAHHPDHSLRFVVNRESDGSIRSLLPFVVRSERVAGAHLSVWRFLGWDRVWQPISYVPASEVGLDDFASYVASVKDEFDAIYFSCPSPLLDRARALLSQQGFRLGDAVEAVCPFVPIDGDWERYWRARGRNLRKNISRTANKAARLNVVFQEKTDLDQEWLFTFLDLHRERWREKGGSKYQEQSHQRYIADLTSALAADGMLYVPYLAQGDKPVALAICARVARKVYYLYPTFDPEYADIAPGRLLMYHILHRAFLDGVEELDLGQVVQYKWEWTSSSRSLVRAMLHRSNTRVWARYEAYPALRRAIGRTVLKDWRRRLIERRRSVVTSGPEEPSTGARQGL